MDSFDKFHHTILSGANPDMDYTKGINHGLFLMSFREASIAVVWYVIIITGGYYFMRSRQQNSMLKPFQLVYNTVQVLLCGYLVVATTLAARNLNYKLVCNKFEYTSPDAPIPWLLYIFYLSKALDFLDTVFIVFHKKDNQLSFLHVYHHITIFLIYWVNANVFYSGDVYYTIVANGAIHTIMYGYYLASGFKSDKGFGRVLTIMTNAVRPFITSAQLIQFITMLTQAVYILYNSCPSPPVVVKYYFVYIMSLFILFMNFFIQNYINKPKKDKKEIKKE